MSNAAAWGGDDGFKFRRTYKKLVENTTINSATLLSTDYLNHFNELVMMLDLVPDMPEMFEEVKDWQPRTYTQHFEASVFTHKDLAIAAYDHVLEEERSALEATVSTMNEMVEGAFEQLPGAIASGDANTVGTICTSVSQNLQLLIDRCSGIINGVDGAAALAVAACQDLNSTTDAEPGEAVADTSDEEEIVMDQSAIDALFD